MPGDTPLQIARRYAAEHPSFEGEVRVMTMTRRTRYFYASGGRAARVMRLHRNGRINGQCAACGRVYPQPVLANGYGPDRRAGQPLAEADRSPFRVGFRDNPVYADVCGLREVCPDCRAAYGLVPQARPSYPAERDQPQPVICEPPGFVCRAMAPAVAKIDLTTQNEQTAAGSGDPAQPRPDRRVG